MFETGKDRLWRVALKSVKEALEAVPAQHRTKLRQTAEVHFPELVSEIVQAREQYANLDDPSEYSAIARQFVSLNLKLFRSVSLFLLGVGK